MTEPLDFWQAFQAVVNRQPQALAISEPGGQSCSYLELAQQALALASQLQQTGLQAGQHIGIAYPRSLAFVRAVLAVWAIGAVWIPLDSDLPPDSDRFQAQLQRAQLSWVLAPESEAKLADWEGDAAERLPLDLPATAPAYLIFTSGSTGQAKGVRLPHAGLVTMLQAQIKAFGLGPADRCLWLLSPLFDASISDWGCALLAGATLVIADDPLRSLPFFYDLLSAQSISYLDLPPALLHALDPEQLPASLKTLVIGGEAPPAEQVRDWASRFRLFNVYGPTEATVCTSLVQCDSDWQEPLLGQPLPGVSYALAIDGQKVDPVQASGAVGELWIASAGLALDYWQDPQLSAERFVQDTQGQRWFCSRDLVRLRADGEYVFVGRLDRQFKARGYLICPEEIETALAALGCQQVAVIQHSRYGLSVFLQSQHPVSELQTALRQRLPAWLIPQRWVLLAEWPLTATAKTDFAALKRWRAKTKQAKSARLAETAAASEMQQPEQLAHIWWQVLTIWPEPEDDFFALGGHSIGVLSAVALAATQGLYLAPEWFYQSPTLAGLSRRLQQATQAEQIGKTLERTGLDCKSDLTQWCEAQSLRAALPAATQLKLQSGNGQRLLLTGASGFLGGRLLVDLLQSGQPLTCLIRAHDLSHARQRLWPLLAKFGLTERLADASTEPQIKLICGDLCRPQLGLSERDYQALIQETAAVIHCAAQVDLVQDRQSLWPGNVEALASIYALGLPLHYVSTLSVIASAHPRPQQASESDRLESTLAVAGGYAQSKWAAEAWLHGQDLEQVWIYRPGLITADSNCDYAPRQDWFSALLQGLLMLGALPELSPESQQLAMDLVPVDFVSAGILSLMSAPAGIYHLANPEALQLDQLWFELEANYRFKHLPVEDWLALATHELLNNDLPAATLLALSQALDLPSHQRWQSLNLFQATALSLMPIARTQAFREQGLLCPSPQHLLRDYLQKRRT